MAANAARHALRGPFKREDGCRCEIETDPTLTNEARRQKLQRLAWFIEGGATDTMKFEQTTTVATGDPSRAQEAAKKERDDDGIKPFRS